MPRNHGGAAMKTVFHLLNDKGRDVWSIAPDATVYEAIELISQKGIGALVVMEGERLVGIISERDYTRKVILKGKSSKKTRVREVMSLQVVCARPEHTVEEAMAIMTHRRIRHLPVVTDERVVGMISIGDAARGMIEEREFHIEQLTNYITGCY